MENQGFRLEQLFGSKTRARLLGLFLLHPDESFFVRELTRKIDAQLNSVRRELKNLIELGMVCEKSAPPARKSKALSEKKRYYAAKKEFILYENLRLLFMKVQILLKKKLVHEIERQGDIAYFAFTGRFMNNSEVPTDVIIVGRIDQGALQKVISQFEKELGHEINYTLMPKEEFLYRRQVMDRFLFSIMEGEKVVMVNRLGL